jgi:FkbM family methyltransferase
MLKKIIKKLLFGKIITILYGNLKGVKIKINHLQKGSVLVQNYEPDKQMAFKLLLTKGQTFFDIGANVGLHSYYACKNIPSIKIHAFEPLPANADYIRETILLNHFTQIELHECAVSSKSGETFFDIQNDNSRGNITETATPDNLKVNLISLDDFIFKTKIFPDLLKIDVEGAEGEVLKGSEILINKYKPIFIIELHSPEQDLYVASFLFERGYEIYRLNEDAKDERHKLLITIKNMEASWPDPDGVYGSIVAIPKEKFKQEYQKFIKS